MLSRVQLRRGDFIAFPKWPPKVLKNAKKAKIELFFLSSEQL